MPRKKIEIENKNKSMSISLTPQQYEFVIKNKNFNLSRYVQIYLQDHINLHYEIMDITEGGNNDEKKTIE